MIQNLAVNTYNTALINDPAGLTDASATAIATTVSSAWNPMLPPESALADAETKLRNTYSKVIGPITHSTRYTLEPDGSGGLKLLCRTKKSILVVLNGDSISVDVSWGEVQ